MLYYLLCPSYKSAESYEVTEPIINQKTEKLPTNSKLDNVGKNIISKK